MLTLLNTRPAHQAAKLNSLLEGVQVGVLLLPSLQIVTSLQDISQLKEKVWVFVSKNAVEHFAKQLSPEQKNWWQAKHLVTVGPATDKACAEQGWGNRQEVPVTYDSEGMIQLEIFEKPQNLTVGIVRGNGGRPWLAEQLTQAGAKVNFYEVYARQAVPLNQDIWQEFTSSKNPVVLFTSVSSMEALLSQLDLTQQAWLKNQNLIVYSARIAEEAQKLKWQGQICITKNSSDEATIETLKTLRH